MAVSKSKTAVTPIHSTTRGVRLRDAASSDPTPEPTPTTLTTTVSGTITIGSGTTAINVPIETTLPPATPGEFVFYYQADSVDSATKIPVGQFIAWAAAQLGATTKASDLPTSLQNLSIAVETLNFDTSGDFDIAVEIGTEADGKFDADWKPISGLALTISDVKLEFKKGTVPPKPAS